MDNVTQLAGLAGTDVRSLRARMAGELVVPGDEGWDEARQAWNLAVDQQPGGGRGRRNAQDVVEVVDFAREAGPAGRGAGDGPQRRRARLARRHDAVKTHQLRGVDDRSRAAHARVEAGAIWIEVVEAAAEHGLAALAGSSPDVGVVGYTLGGGLSLARAQARHRREPGDGDRDRDGGRRAAARRPRERARPVLGAARRRRRLRRRHRDRVRAVPVHGRSTPGVLWFPVERAAEVLRAWRDWRTPCPTS